MLSPELITPPTGEVISLAEAKDHLRVTNTASDSYITALIGVAVQKLDGWDGELGSCLVTQTWLQGYACFNHPVRLMLPLNPIQQVTVNYTDTQGVDQVLDAASYRLYQSPLGWYIALNDGETWPATAIRDDAVRVEIVAGYGTTGDDVPLPIIQAMLLLIGHWFENREAVNVGNIVTTFPLAVDALLANYRYRSSIG